MIFISNSNLTSNHKKWFNANIAQPLKGVVADVVQDIERFNIGNEAEADVLGGVSRGTLDRPWTDKYSTVWDLIPLFVSK